MRRMGGWTRGLLAAALIAGAGCVGPQHLGDGVGRSTRMAFDRQAVRPPSEACAVAVTGLDSQEAAIISDAYRRSLAPKGAAVEEEPVLFVAPQPANAMNRPLPPPSVPQERR